MNKRFLTALLSILTLSLGTVPHAIAQDYRILPRRRHRGRDALVPRHAGARVASGYMRITNTGSEPDRLVGGSTVVAERFEVHRSTVSNGVARMEPIAGGLEIGPGQTVELKPDPCTPCSST